MMTIANSIYAGLKKKGLHNWGFLGGKSDFDFMFDDMDLLYFDDWDDWERMLMDESARLSALEE